MILLALALASATPVANAKVYGLGMLSCGRWAAAKQDAGDQMMRVALTVWVGGYLSGYNHHAGGDVLHGLDNDAATGWIDQYCPAHPLETVSHAAGQLITKLQGEVPR